MLNPQITAESVIGAALKEHGINYLLFATAGHSDDWFKGNTFCRLERRFRSLFQSGPEDPDRVVIVVDCHHRQYVVADMNEIVRVWSKGQILYALTMKKDVLESLRRDVALRAIPELEPA